MYEIERGVVGFLRCKRAAHDVGQLAAHGVRAMAHDLLPQLVRGVERDVEIHYTCEGPQRDQLVRVEDRGAWGIY